VHQDRYANLTPGAVSAALRSFPRRYLAAFGADPTLEPADVAARTARDGHTVREGLADTVAALEQLAKAVERVLLTAKPSLPGAATGERVHDAETTPQPLAALATRLEAAASTLATRLDDAPAADLLRTGTAPSGAEVSALDIGRQAVRLTAEHLRAVEQALGTNAAERDDTDDD
jgi:hypothetical protein